MNGPVVAQPSGCGYAALRGDRPVTGDTAFSDHRSTRDQG